MIVSIVDRGEHRQMSRFAVVRGNDAVAWFPSREMCIEYIIKNQLQGRRRIGDGFRHAFRLLSETA